MSGTSMDGLDIALCLIKGSGIESDIEILQFKTADYSDSFRNAIKSIFSNRAADLQMVTVLNEVVAIEHAKLVNQALDEWGVDNKSVDIIASHGQTIFHAPKSFHNMEEFPNATLQIGDGDHIAVNTGILTISDFRQKHIAWGGEGAPLAVYGDYLLFSKKGENRVLLNIGGIANFTFLPGDAQAEKIFTTDVGPGNTLMDQYMFREFGLFFDEDAKVAKAGDVNERLLETLLAHKFFTEDFPKSTGPELFNLDYLDNSIFDLDLKEISKEDVMATLCAFSATAIAEAITKTLNVKSTIYLSGGGMHNPLLIDKLKMLLPQNKFSDTYSLGILPDAKEAVLFAVLANEAVAGAAIEFNSVDIPGTTFGKISFPR